MKKILSALAFAALIGSSVASASPLVTADVPLDSNYYGYLEKLEGMGYVSGVPAGTKPFSRLDMAKWVLEAETVAKNKPMPKYLQTYYDTMHNDLAEEIAYLQGDNFKSNLKLRGVDVEFSHVSQDSAAYKYSNANASWQLGFAFGSKQDE